MDAEPSSNSPALPTMSWEMLEQSLAHSNVLIREKAIETAGHFPDRRSVTALQLAVREEDSRIRDVAAQALVQAIMQQHSEVDSALAEIISASADEDLRIFLTTHAASSGSETLLREIILRLVDSNAAISAAAEAALKERPGWVLSNAASEILPLIDIARSSPDAGIADRAAALTESLQRAQLRRTMLDTGVATILALTAALRSSNALVRATAAEALQQTADARALPVLREALRDSDEEVRRSAALALGTLKWSPGSEEDLAYFLVALGRWNAALTLGSTAVDALLLSATRSTSTVQLAAIKTLSETGSVRAMTPLVKLLSSPNSSVRKAAAQGLEILEWVPVSEQQAITHAIELEDWPAAVSFGIESILPLIAALKASHEQPGRRGVILSSLMTLDDPKAAEVLVPFCRDGEVAGIVVIALESLVERTGHEISDEALETITSLKNVVQFQFAMEATYGRLVRKGMEFVNLDNLRAQASAEIARRADVESNVFIVSNGGENL